MFRYQNDMEMFQAALGIQSLGLLDIGNSIKAGSSRFVDDSWFIGRCLSAGCSLPRGIISINDNFFNGRGQFMRKISQNPSFDNH
jgi:hypothetical protein